MCFNQKYSAIFAVLGIVSLVVVRNNPHPGNNLMYIPIIFYTIMEVLQTIQYSYTNKCDGINHFLTEISYILILVQPIMWNLIFLYKMRSKPLTRFHKGILYCAVVLCGVWILAHVARRFRGYSDYNPSKVYDPKNEMTGGSRTCTYKERNQHLYWNYELFSIPGLDANWFMYIALWFIPGLLIPGEKMTIGVLMAGFAASFLYVRLNGHNHHITPSLWCLTSAPILAVDVFLYSLLKL